MPAVFASILPSLAIAENAGGPAALDAIFDLLPTQVGATLMDSSNSLHLRAGTLASHLDLCCKPSLD